MLRTRAVVEQARAAVLFRATVMRPGLTTVLLARLDRALRKRMDPMPSWQNPHYCRFGEGSDLYVWRSRALHCSDCRLAQLQSFDVSTAAEMLRHVEQHAEAGHAVPVAALELLHRDAAIEGTTLLQAARNDARALVRWLRGGNDER